MKNLYIILLLAFFFCTGGCSTVVISQEADDVKSHFDWLLGSWIRVNEEGEKQTYELWEKSNDSTYYGFGYTLLKSDTVWKEKIRLIKTVEEWNFEVRGEGESTPTVFKVTEYTQDAFTSQNPQHDFPTQIKLSKC